MVEYETPLIIETPKDETPIDETPIDETPIIIDTPKDEIPIIEGMIYEGTIEWSLYLLRNTRNGFLALTDKYLLPDYPITDEKKEIIIKYRQNLREFINIHKDDILNGIEVEIPLIPI